MNPSDILDIFKFIGGGIEKLLNMKKDARVETAKNLFLLSKVFDEFPSAYQNKEYEKLIKLSSKTQGIIDAIKADEAFTQCLGEELAKKFIDAIQVVQNWKEFLTDGHPDNENRIKAIIKASGYVEGYAEVLSPGAKDA